MKKALVGLLVGLAMVLSVSVCFAATEGDTVLSTTVPGATYTLNVPANTTVPYGNTDYEIGNISITDGKGFALGKNVKVTVTYESFECENENVKTTIPFSLDAYYKYNGEKLRKSLSSGSAILFHGNTSGGVDNAYIEATGTYKYHFQLNNINVYSGSTDWGKAEPGNYSATLHFATEVINGELE